MNADAGASEPAGIEVAEGSGDRVLLLTDPAMERHAAPGHPERHERLAAVAAGVMDGAAVSRAELSVRAPDPANDDAITAVHDREYLQALDQLDAGGGGWIDADTYLAPGSMHAARLAAGAAIEAALAVTSGEFVIAFSVSRPPGHHASARRAAGFCLLNNIAIAAVALRSAGQAQRIAILDWDVHHGDGTQAIFDEDPDLLYASTHQRPLYPGSGSPDERGLGAAAGTMHNMTLSPGADDDAFVEAWQGLLEAVREFRPGAILISAGYDGHRDDPLANLAITEDGYRAVSEAVAALTEELGLPGTALVLEGGYDLRALERSAAATVEGLLRGRSGAASGGSSWG
jgi:acetoin utilization deacetylase AcuC-like enzyme